MSEETDMRAETRRGEESSRPTRDSPTTAGLASVGSKEDRQPREDTKTTKTTTRKRRRLDNPENKADQTEDAAERETDKVQARPRQEKPLTAPRESGSGAQTASTRGKSSGETSRTRPQTSEVSRATDKSNVNIGIAHGDRGVAVAPSTSQTTSPRRGSQHEGSSSDEAQSRSGGEDGRTGQQRTPATSADDDFFRPGSGKMGFSRLLAPSPSDDSDSSEEVVDPDRTPPRSRPVRHRPTRKRASGGKWLAQPAPKQDPELPIPAKTTSSFYGRRVSTVAGGGALHSGCLQQQGDRAAAPRKSLGPSEAVDPCEGDGAAEVSPRKRSRQEQSLSSPWQALPPAQSSRHGEPHSAHPSPRGHGRQAGAGGDWSESSSPEKTQKKKPKADQALSASPPRLQSSPPAKSDLDPSRPRGDSGGHQRRGNSRQRSPQPHGTPPPPGTAGATGTPRARRGRGPAAQAGRFVSTPTKRGCGPTPRSLSGGRPRGGRSQDLTPPRHAGEEARRYPGDSRLLPTRGGKKPRRSGLPLSSEPARYESPDFGLDVQEAPRASRDSPGAGSPGVGSGSRVQGRRRVSQNTAAPPTKNTAASPTRNTATPPGSVPAPQPRTPGRPAPPEERRRSPRLAHHAPGPGLSGPGHGGLGQGRETPGAGQSGLGQGRETAGQSGLGQGRETPGEGHSGLGQGREMPGEGHASCSSSSSQDSPPAPGLYHTDDEESDPGQEQRSRGRPRRRTLTKVRPR